MVTELDYARLFENQFDRDGKMPIVDGMRYYKKTDGQNNVPRFTIVLKEPVDRACLEHAAKLAVDRHRTMRLTVVHDDKRFYLKEIQAPVTVHQDGENLRNTIGGDIDGGRLIRIGYEGCTLSLDFFHGLTDGMGFISFCGTLLYYYCLEKYGGEIDTSGIILSDTPEDPREYADSLLFVPEEPVETEKYYEYEKAFQLPDTQMECEYECKYYELRVDAASFESFMRKNSSSRSAVFALFMNRVIAQVNGLGDEPVVAALAMDARRALGAEKTMQCCVSTVPIWFDKEISRLPLSEQLSASREMIAEGTKPQRVIAAAQRTKRFNETLEERFSTLAEKQAFARKVNKQGGVKYTYGLSYLGAVSYGRGIDEHVVGTSATLCANTIPLIIETAKCRDQYIINYCTHIENDPYVLRYRDMFIENGIACSCKQKDNFREPLVLY